MIDNNKNNIHNVFIQAYFPGDLRKNCRHDKCSALSILFIQHNQDSTSITVLGMVIP